LESEKKNLQEIINYRLEKLKKIILAGYNPYAYNFDKTHDIKLIINKGKKFLGKEFKTAGRMVSFRKMGKASFTHIQDDSGKIQVYLKNDLLPDSVYDDIVRNLDLGDIIACTGKLFMTKMGELSIQADNVIILSKNIEFENIVDAYPICRTPIPQHFWRSGWCGNLRQECWIRVDKTRT